MTYPGYFRNYLSRKLSALKNWYVILVISCLPVPFLAVLYSWTVKRVSEKLQVVIVEGM